MRSHKAIIQAHGASKLHRDLAGVGIDLHKSTPQRWAERDSIPGEYWEPIARLGIATLEELAKGAASRLQSPSEEAA